jgi:hypothetical protein
MVIAVYGNSQAGCDNKIALGEAKSDGMSFFERAMQHYVIDHKPGSGAVAATISDAAKAQERRSKTAHEIE